MNDPNRNRDRETGSPYLPAGVSESDFDGDEEDNHADDWERGWEVPD